MNIKLVEAGDGLAVKMVFFNNKFIGLTLTPQEGGCDAVRPNGLYCSYDNEDDAIDYLKRKFSTTKV